MRPVLLLPVTLMVVAGCGSQRGEEVALSKLERDLALPARAPEVQVASPVELGRTEARSSNRPARRTPRRPRQVAPTIVPVALKAVTVPAHLAEQPVVEATSAAAIPANDRELPPGKTVTIIPTSSGPSTDGSGGVDEPPPERGRPMVRGGGTCRGRGRGPGIGIAAVPRPRFR
jgi:hypothetical protein